MALPEGCVKHPKYWFDDEGRILVFRAGNTLYRVTVSPLTLHSEFVRDLWELSKLPSMLDSKNCERLPQHPGDPGSVSNPIALPGISDDEFTVILDWVWHSPHQPPSFDARLLVALLTSARYLMMPELPPLSPVQIVHLATSVPVFDEDLLHPAVASLIQAGPEKLSAEDEEKLGARIVGIIAKAHVRILAERARLAQSMPTVGPSDECNVPRHERLCVPNFAKLWWNEVGRRLLNPDKPIPLDEVVNVVRRMVVICASCARSSI
ncbi:hypothetical protein K435DRAFT_809402 [Dendrothele bispora CBS 962.96]|uniref:BTB domain-containing protein n=1 Tax=Dendrothele bispora (strain CBS 962.96) TaxID=1314807 RepID=A0A4S8KYS9_DENBC|nr:hypothetical protein K435DRAFT_809402 [Dendrothele bispora CBS 962.96]